MSVDKGASVLYVGRAIKHTLLLRQMIVRLEAQSNTNMMGPIEALQKELEKLIKEDPAYQEAKRIIDELFRAKLIRLAGVRR